jgi:hypothetical protein
MNVLEDYIILLFYKLIWNGVMLKTKKKHQIFSVDLEHSVSLAFLRKKIIEMS